MAITRPMLAGKVEDIEDLNYPLLASTKLDGIRCLVIKGRALSRSFKPIRNSFTREWVENNLPDGIDGELIIKGKSFSDISSGIMSEDGRPDFRFMAFDFAPGEDTELPFEERIRNLSACFTKATWPSRLEILEQGIIKTPKDLSLYEEFCLNAGFEGVMLRDPKGPYKSGRSTLREGWLLKLKRFEDSEAEILGFEELMSNQNVKEMNELGRMKRSSHIEGQVPADTLGRFIVRDIHSGVEFRIGTGQGLTHELRQEIWDHQKGYLGKLVKYKFQRYGTKDLPRMPIFMGFRDREDL